MESRLCSLNRLPILCVLLAIIFLAFQRRVEALVCAMVGLVGLTLVEDYYTVPKTPRKRLRTEGFQGGENAKDNERPRIILTNDGVILQKRAKTVPAPPIVEEEEEEEPPPPEEEEEEEPPPALEEEEPPALEEKSQTIDVQNKKSLLHDETDDSQLTGLVYGDYSSGPRYAKYSNQLAQQHHWRCILEGNGQNPRDRLGRVFPRVSIYRDRTGQTSRFSNLS